MEHIAVAEVPQVPTQHFPVENAEPRRTVRVQKRQRCEARVRYKRDDKRGDVLERITLDAAVARINGYNAFAKEIGVDGIGLYWLMAENNLTTRAAIMEATGWAKAKTTAVLKKLLDLNLLHKEEGGYAESDTYTLLCRPHPKDDAKSFVIHQAENRPNGEGAPSSGRKSASIGPKTGPHCAENRPAYKEVVQQIRIKDQNSKADQHQHQEHAGDGGEPAGVFFDQNQTQEQPQQQERPAPGIGGPVVLEGEVLGADAGPAPRGRPSDAAVEALHRQLRRSMYPGLGRPHKTANQMVVRHVHCLAQDLLPLYDEAVIVAAWRLWQRMEMLEPLDHTTSHPVHDFRTGVRRDECITRVAPIAHDEQALTALLDEYPDKQMDYGQLQTWKAMRHFREERRQRHEAQAREIVSQQQEADGTMLTREETEHVVQQVAQNLAANEELEAQAREAAKQAELQAQQAAKRAEEQRQTQEKAEREAAEQQRQKAAEELKARKQREVEAALEALCAYIHRKHVEIRGWDFEEGEKFRSRLREKLHRHWHLYQEVEGGWASGLELGVDQFFTNRWTADWDVGLIDTRM